MQTFTHETDTFMRGEGLSKWELKFPPQAPHEEIRTKIESPRDVRLSEEGRKMANTHSTSVSTMNAFLTLAGTKARYTLAALTTLLFSLTCMAQDNPPSQPQPNSAPDSQTMQASASPTAIQKIPTGTRIALVLTHPIQSRYIHRGDDIYAQIIAPINSGNQVMIPPGTLIDGKVDKLQVRSGRAELYLQSMSMTFPDGYVVPVPGAAVLEGVEGYALKDPGQRRMAGVLVLAAGGAGLGALIGHSVGQPQSSVTSNFPPGCTGAPPYCTPETTPVYSTQGRDTAMGAGLGVAIAAVASVVLLANSHQFFLDAGAPLDVELQQPLSLQRNQADEARQSEQHPVAIQPIAPRPLPPPPPPDTDHGTCYTPGTPGTPPTVIPGTPGPDGIPGPPTIIPGTPSTPGTPYPCP